MLQSLAISHLITIAAESTQRALFHVISQKFSCLRSDGLQALRVQLFNCNFNKIFKFIYPMYPLCTTIIFSQRGVAAWLILKLYWQISVSLSPFSVKMHYASFNSKFYSTFSGWLAGWKRYRCSNFSMCFSSRWWMFTAEAPKTLQRRKALFSHII